MDYFRKQLGKRGEDLATQYLISKGYQVVQRNYLLRNGEIDIIAIENPRLPADQRTLVFFEVKTRSSNDYGTPLEAITYFKMKALIRAAEFYKHSHKNLPDGMRIDAISVTLLPSGELDEIEQVRNISQ